METKDTSTLEGSLNSDDRISLLNDDEMKKNMPSYHRSYCQTDFTKNIFYYTWHLEHFDILSKTRTKIQSAAFPDTAQYKFEMQFHTPPNSYDIVIKFYIFTEESFLGSYDISSTKLMNKTRLCTKTCYIENGSCVYETTANALSQKMNEQSLTLNFTIKVFCDILTKTLHMKSVPLDNMPNMEKYEQLIVANASVGPYVTFKLDEKTSFDIPKQLLGAIESSYFSSICKKYPEENKNMIITLNIETISSHYLLMMLEFIKTGSLPTWNTLEYSDILMLLRLSFSYDVKDLQVACETILIHNITVENVRDILDITMTMSTTILKEHVMAFIKFHLDKLTKTGLFEELPLLYVKEIKESIAEYKIDIESVPFIERSESS